ncbi:MAG: ADP-glyceromanno-heptose 6-epimerase [Chlorobi bacterium]|nr:ADP-glyceromanno-heptose 6-epimerase [Chlorobiota bacterium]
MIALTGGAGFIGSAMLWRLNAEGIGDVIVVDRLGSDLKWKNLVGKRYRYLATPDEFLAGLERDAFGRLDAIVHFGARTDTTERDAEYLAQNNYRYSVRLAEYALSRGIPFVYASSASVYGDGALGWSVGRTRDLRPLNAYAMSKYMFDCWVEEHDALDSVCGLRFFNVFGPNEYHKGAMASMVYKSFGQIQRTGKVHLFESTTPDYADGEQRRDFVYVKDVVEIVWHILRLQWSEQSIRGIYNVGSGLARSWNDLARAVFAALDREPMIVYIPMPDDLRGQYQNFTCADMQPLADAFRQRGLTLPATSLDDAVGDYVRNYLLGSWQYL